MNLVGMVERVREQWLAAAGLSLALLALVLGSLPGSSEPETEVLALRHSIVAGGVVRAADVVAVRLGESNRTPSMLTELGDLTGRRTAVSLAGGDFLLRGTLVSPNRPSLLGRGERAVALEMASAAAPDVRLLRAGRRVDVVIIGPRGPRVAARALELLSPAVERSGGIAVTLRAPAALALALATDRPGSELRLLLRGEAA